MCRPGGVVAVRDSDYAAMTWYPARPPARPTGSTVYRAVARGNDAEPDAGRHLLGVGADRRVHDVTSSASAWCFADPGRRAWWGGLWADRITRVVAGRTGASSGGSRPPSCSTSWRRAWREWAAHPDGWFVVVNGEILARA